MNQRASARETTEDAYLHLDLFSTEATKDRSGVACFKYLALYYTIIPAPVKRNVVR